LGMSKPSSNNGATAATSIFMQIPGNVASALSANQCDGKGI